MIDGLHVRLVNAFVAASSSVLGRALNEHPERGSPSFRYVGRGGNPVTVAVGIVGSVFGEIRFGMSLATATRIAAAITGRPVVTFDGTTADVLSLLAERICADALTELTSLGLALGATEPVIVRAASRGEDEATPSIVVPFRLGCGRLDLTVGLRLPHALPLSGLALADPVRQPAAPRDPRNPIERGGIE